MSLTQKIKTLPQRTFARILYSIKESPWWIEYEKKMNFDAVEDRIERIKSTLGTNTYGEYVMFDNTIKQLKSTCVVNNKAWDPSEVELTNIATVIREMKPITKVVKIQAMDNPVCQGMLMRYRGTTPSNGITMEVLKVIAEARSRKCTTKIHAGLLSSDNQVITTDFAKSIVSELATAVFKEIISVSPKVTLSAENDVGVLKPEQLVGEIRNQVSSITATTHRSSQFFVIGKHDTLASLKSSPDFKESESLDTAMIASMGKIDTNIDVFTSSTVDDNVVLVGYYSDIVMDNGLVFMPYTPLMEAGVTMDPSTFEPSRNFLTRFGFAADNRTGDYYRVIDVSALKK